MKNKTMKISLILLTLLNSIHAQAIDVFGADAHFVKVTEDASRMNVKFELCNLITLSDCTPIGSKSFYSKKKLKALQESESWDVFKAVAADVAIVVGTAATGGVIGYALTANSFIAVTLFGTVGAVGAGGLTGTLITTQVDMLNPYEQHKQIETLDAGVLNDKKVIVEYDVKTFAKRLSAVLDNI